jgi:hypothetical protein
VKKKNFVLQNVHDAHVATTVLTQNVNLNKKMFQFKNNE